MYQSGLFFCERQTEHAAAAATAAWTHPVLMKRSWPSRTAAMIALCTPQWLSRMRTRCTTKETTCAWAR